MSSNEQPNNSHLPIARQLSNRSSENMSEKTIEPPDSISMRKVTKISSLPSINTMQSNCTGKATSKSEDLESQSSIRKVFDAHSASSSNPTKGRKASSWMAKLHPSAQTIEDAVMGTSDGMTVPFALTASLAGFAPNARYVMLAGLAELTAGAISMALGGALQARCEKETYDATVKSTEATLLSTPDYIPTTIDDLFSPWHFTPETLAHISHDLSLLPLPAQTSFLVRFHRQLPTPSSTRVLTSAATLGTSYFLAGFLGLLPYMVVQRTQIREALWASVAVEAVALWGFGWVKTGVSVGWRGRGNVRRGVGGAVMMVAVGAVASGVAVGLITGVNRGEHVAG